MAAELVHICTSPSPPNPFAVDFDYFEALHLPERALASGAMVAFLQKVLESGPHPYDRRGMYYHVIRVYFRAWSYDLQCQGNCDVITHASNNMTGEVCTTTTGIM